MDPFDMSPAFVSHLGNFLITFPSLQAGAVALTQNAYLFEQVGPQPNKDRTKIFQTKQTKFPEISIKIFILFLGLILESGFLEGKHKVLPIGSHTIVTHFCRKLTSCTGFRVRTSCAETEAMPAAQLSHFFPRGVHCTCPMS